MDAPAFSSAKVCEFLCYILYAVDIVRRVVETKYYFNSVLRQKAYVRHYPFIRTKPVGCVSYLVVLFLVAVEGNLHVFEIIGAKLFNYRLGKQESVRSRIGFESDTVLITYGVGIFDQWLHDLGIIYKRLPAEKGQGHVLTLLR